MAVSPYRRGAPVLAFVIAGISAAAGAAVLNAQSRPPVVAQPARTAEPTAAPTSDDGAPPTRARAPVTIPVVTEPPGAAVFTSSNFGRMRVCAATPCSFVVQADQIESTVVSLELPDRAPVKAWVRDVAAVPGGGTLMLTFPPAAALPRSAAAPTLRQGALHVEGRLPPEVIQRIVRQNYGRFRLCYENALRRNAGIGGRVTAHFVIDRSGAVANVVDRSSDLGDAEAVACVIRNFGNLSFPQPEGGVVTVDYAILFNPPDS